MATTALAEIPRTEEWKWTKKKKRCLDLFAQGVPQLQIAEQLEVHRNTIGAWVKHPLFLTRLANALQEKQGTSKLRRVHTAQNFRVRMERLANKALAKADKDESDPIAFRRLREVMDEYRKTSAEERVEAGEDTKRIEYINGGDTGGPKRISSGDLKAALIEAATQGRISLKEIMEAATPEEALKLATRALLASDDKLLSEVHAIDVEAEEVG